MAARAIDSLEQPYYGCLLSAGGRRPLADRLPGPILLWAYGGDAMVDDRGQSHTNSAPVQFGIFDWIDQNQLQAPGPVRAALQCLEYADEAGFL